MVTKRKQQLVRNKPHELEKVIKSLTAESAKAVKKLALLCDNEDSKIALEASKALLSNLKEMSTAYHRDEMQGLLVQAKLNGGFTPIEDDDTPMVDFNSIQET